MPTTACLLAFHVDRDHPIELLLRVVEQPGDRPEDSRVVEEVVEAPEPLAGAVHVAAHVGRLGHVGVDDQRLTPRALNGGSRLLDVGPFEVDQHQVGAVLGESLRGRPPEAASRASHSGDFALETIGHAELLGWSWCRWRSVAQMLKEAVPQ
jgi:hypothetical protein